MIDFNKPVQTRSGWPARVICTDRDRQCWPVVALVGHPNTEVGEIIYSYTAEGMVSMTVKDGPMDLVNVPYITTEFVNYRHGDATSVELLS